MTKRPAKVIKCVCGEMITCSGFTNTCSGCNPPKDYNWNGNQLAPRSCWGAETGETADEILGYDGMSVDQLLDGED